MSFVHLSSYRMNMMESSTNSTFQWIKNSFHPLIVDHNLYLLDTKWNRYLHFAAVNDQDDWFFQWNFMRWITKSRQIKKRLLKNSNHAASAITSQTVASLIFQYAPMNHWLCTFHFICVFFLLLKLLESDLFTIHVRVQLRNINWPRPIINSRWREEKKTE